MSDISKQDCIHSKHIPYFPRVSAPRRLPIFEDFGGALIKTYENLDLPFPAHTRWLFIIYDS